MKILFAISSLSCGGAEKVLTAIANHFSVNGHEISIVTLDCGLDQPFFRLEPSINLISMGLQNKSKNIANAIKWNGQRVKALHRLLVKESPDVVVSFLNRTSVLTILASQGTGIPVIASERNYPAYTTSNFFWYVLTIIAYLKCKYLVLQTEAFLKDYWFLPPKKMKVIPNPVFPPHVVEAPDLDPIIGPAITAIGKLEQQKGFDRLIEAFTHVHVNHPDWKLYLFGKGSQAQALADLVARFGLENDVIFMGQTKTPAYYLRHSVIFVLSSRYEGFPNVLVEAMAVGTAVIATDCSGAIADIIDDGKNGLIIDNDSIHALAKAMERLIKDKTLRIDLANQAKSVPQKFHSGKIFDRWASIIGG